MNPEKIRNSVRLSTSELIARSSILKKEKDEDLPHFDLPEIEKDKRLGTGAFGIVWEVSCLKISKKVSSTLVHEEKKDDDDELDARQFIANTCRQNSTNACRYAIKILRPEIVNGDPTTFEKGCADLVMEAKFLSSFVHPNIIKVRGVAEEKLLGTKDYFLVMDRLYGTLETTMEEWKLKKKKMGVFTKKGAKNEFLKERLIVAFELSAALNYMHERKIIYRDLKPENLGFDIRGDVKIFDLGFARELTPDLNAGTDEWGEDAYKLTGKCGTLVYMAPEVVLMKPYNLKADVYSFSILLWEFFHLGNEPFPKCTSSIHERLVCKGTLRPKMEKKVPKGVSSLITECWAKQTSKRPGMMSVNLKLKREIKALQDGKDGKKMDFTRRRSTFVFEKES